MDWHEMHALFNVVEKSMGHPNLKAIRDEAMKTLQEHAEIIKRGKPEPKPEPEARPFIEPPEEPEPERRRG